MDDTYLLISREPIKRYKRYHCCSGLSLIVSEASKQINEVTLAWDRSRYCRSVRALGSLCQTLRVCFCWQQHLCSLKPNQWFQRIHNPYVRSCCVPGGVSFSGRAPSTDRCFHSLATVHTFTTTTTTVQTKSWLFDLQQYVQSFKEFQ